MSEKRFTFYYERGNEVVIEDNGKRLSNKKVVDLLNELNDENEKLRDIHLSIDLTYSYGYGRYLADVRVIDNE